MINFLLKKTQNNETKVNVFIYFKLLIISLLVSMQPYAVNATNSFQYTTTDLKSVNNNCFINLLDEDTAINLDNLDNSEEVLTKNEVISKIHHRLNKIRDIYHESMVNNVSVPSEVNVSLQTSLLDTMTLINKNNNSIPFIRLPDLKQQFIDLIKQKDGSKTFVLTSLGFYNQLDIIIESDNTKDIQDKLLERLNNYMPFKLEYYNNESRYTANFLFQPLQASNEDIDLATNKIFEIIKKYQQMPKDVQQKNKLKISHNDLLYNGSCYFNHKTTTVPHSNALYARIKNNKIDILIFEPGLNLASDYNGICLQEVIHRTMQKLIKEEFYPQISFDIYHIPLSVQLSGADCMTHSYEICTEIYKNITCIESICNYIDDNSSKTDIYKHILNNIPVTFFKTIYQLDFLEHIIEVNNDKRADEVFALKDRLKKSCKTKYSIFSTAITEMGLYKDDKYQVVEKFKLHCDEYTNTHNYLGCFKEVNTLIPSTQLNLAESAIDSLFTNNTIDTLTMNMLLKLDKATEDIDTISDERLNSALEFATKVENHFHEYAHIYYRDKLKKFISILIKFYNINIKKRAFGSIKEEIAKVDIYAEVTKKQKYQNIGNVDLDLGKYKQQINSVDPEILLAQSLNILQEKSDLFLNKEDKLQIATEIQQFKNIVDKLTDDIKNNIQPLFVNNNLDIQITDFFLQTDYSEQINIYFFNLLNSKIENIINIFEIDSDNFFQEILKEKTISIHKEHVLKETNQ